MESAKIHLIRMGVLRGSARLMFLAAVAVLGSLAFSAPAGAYLFSPTSFGTGAAPISVAVSDFSGDGKPDLAVANNESANVSVLLGDGNGSFGPATNFGTGTSPVSLATGELNGDGFDDLAVANFSSDSASVLFGDGAGSFGPASDLAVGSKPLGIAIGNLKDDAFEDIVVANSSSDDVSVLAGEGSGAFLSSSVFGVGQTPSSGRTPNDVKIADLNGDGFSDLAVSSLDSYDVSILLGAGDGTFVPAATFDIEGFPTSLAIGDLDGDTDPDIAVASGEGSSVGVLLGDGTGSFDGPSYFAAGSYPAEVAIGDLTGDDVPDLVVPNYESRSVSVLRGNGDGTFRPRASFQVGNKPTSVRVADLNADGLSDLAVANEGSDNVAVLLGGGPLRATISRVLVGGPAKVKRGRFYAYPVRITNTGSAPASGVKLTVSFRGTKGSTRVGSIRSGETETVGPRLRFRRPGSTTVRFKITSANAGTRTVTRTVRVKR
jgi:hypothetical protein